MRFYQSIMDLGWRIVWTVLKRGSWYHFWHRRTPSRPLRTMRQSHRCVLESLERREVFAGSMLLFIDIGETKSFRPSIENTLASNESSLMPPVIVLTKELRLTTIVSSHNSFRISPELVEGNRKPEDAVFGTNGLVGEGESSPFPPASVSGFHSGFRGNGNPNAALTMPFPSEQARSLEVEFRLPALGMQPTISLRSSISHSEITPTNLNLAKSGVEAASKEQPSQTYMMSNKWLIVPNSMSQSVERENATPLFDHSLDLESEFFAGDLMDQIMSDESQSDNKHTIFKLTIDDRKNGNGHSDRKDGEIPFCTETTDGLDVPPGMVYLELPSPLGLSKRVDIGSGLPLNASSVGMLQWFATYEDTPFAKLDWPPKSDCGIEGPRTGNLNANGSSSTSGAELMFVLVVSGAISSSRAYLSAKKNRAINRWTSPIEETGSATDEWVKRF